MKKGTRLIRLTQGKFAIVDEIDYDLVNHWKWHAVTYGGKRWYAVRVETRINGKRKHVLMHRVISDRMGLPESRYYDHKDHNGLNNTRDNIRACNQSQNNANQRKRAGCTSKYKGVTWHRQRRKWQAAIAKDKRSFHLGLFDSEEAAAAVYWESAIKLYGEFAFAPDV